MSNRIVQDLTARKLQLFCSVFGAEAESIFARTTSVEGDNMTGKSHGILAMF